MKIIRPRPNKRFWTQRFSNSERVDSRLSLSKEKEKIEKICNREERLLLLLLLLLQKMISVRAVNSCSIFRSSPPVSSFRCRLNSHLRTTTSSSHHDRYSKSGFGFPMFRFDLPILGHGDVRSYSLQSFVDTVLEELASYRKRKRQGICSAIKFRLILTFLIYY